MRTVAILGASNDRQKFGNKAVRAFQRRGYRVFPINPHEATIEGLPAFKSIRELPVQPDVVSVYVRPEILPRLLPDIAERGCQELWLNPGTESPEAVEAAEKLGLNVIQACSIIGIGERP